MDKRLLIIYIAKLLAIHDRLADSAFGLSNALGLISENSAFDASATELLDVILSLAGVPEESDEFSRDWWYDEVYGDERDMYIHWDESVDHREEYLNLARRLMLEKEGRQ